MNEIDLIKQYIQKNNLTNKEFAQLIGYDRVSWQKIKSGIVPLSQHFIKNVERAVPDIFLSINSADDANIPSADEKPHSQKLGALKRLIDKLPIRKIHSNRGEAPQSKIRGR